MNIRITMTQSAQHLRSRSMTAAALLFSALPFHAQNPEVQQRLAEIKQASAANKQRSLITPGKNSRRQALRVRLKSNRSSRSPLGPMVSSRRPRSAARKLRPPSGGRLKQHIVEKKTAEFKDYGEQIADLAKQYTQPDPAKTAAAFQAGNVSLQSGGGEGIVTLVIKNYIKPNDSVTLMFNRQNKGIQSIQSCELSGRSLRCRDHRGTVRQAA